MNVDASNHVMLLVGTHAEPGANVEFDVCARSQDSSDVVRQVITLAVTPPLTLTDGHGVSPARVCNPPARATCASAPPRTRSHPRSCCRSP